MPSLNNLNLHFKNDPFVLVAVDVGEKKDTVRKFMERKRYSFVNALDEDRTVSTLFGVRSHPMKFLINREGMLIGAALGYREWDAEEMKSLICSLSESKKHFC